MGKKIIKLEIKNVYGTDKAYPLTNVNELYGLTKTKTLSQEHLNALKDLGFEFEVVKRPKSLVF